MVETSVWPSASSARSIARALVADADHHVADAERGKDGEMALQQGATSEIQQNLWAYRGPGAVRLRRRG